MKKMLIIISLLSASLAFGVVWEDDPSFTPGERQRAREHNERMRQRNEAREAKKNKLIAELSQKYQEAWRNAFKRLEDNANFQKDITATLNKRAEEMVLLTGQYDPEIQRYIKEAHAKRMDQLHNPAKTADDVRRINEEWSYAMRTKSIDIGMSAAGISGEGFKSILPAAVVNNPDYQNALNAISIRFALPVLAKYDADMKKYFNEFKEVEGKYQPFMG